MITGEEHRKNAERAQFLLIYQMRRMMEASARVVEAETPEQAKRALREVNSVTCQANEIVSTWEQAEKLGAKAEEAEVAAPHLA